MKKRVGLFLAIEPTWGGAFQYNQTILDALANLPKDKYEVVIGYSDESWLSHLASYKFKTVSIPLGSGGRFFGQLLHFGHISCKLWRLLTPYFHPTVRAFIQEKCDLWIFPSQDPWAYLADVPALATIHDLMHRYERRFPEVGNRKEFLWREWHYKNTCLYSRGILVDSEVGKQHVVESYAPAVSRVHVLPFIAPAYLSNEPPLNDPLSIYSVPDKFIFYPAQHWEHKNHKRLLHVIAILKERFPDIKLVCAGAPKNAYNSTSKLIEKLGLSKEVQFLGYVSDSAMTGLYRQARALVMPTFFGPTNIPPLEAMTVGCPAAVSNIYGMPEQVKGAALLFDPESIDEIASVIARLWSDDELCRTLVAKGYQVCREWDNTAFNKRLESIILTVLNQTPGEFTT